VKVHKKVISDIKKSIRLETGKKYSMFHVEKRKEEFDASGWPSPDAEEAFPETVRIEHIEQNDRIKNPSFVIRVFAADQDQLAYGGGDRFFVLVDGRAVQKVSKEFKTLKGG